MLHSRKDENITKTKLCGLIVTVYCWNM